MLKWHIWLKLICWYQLSNELQSLEKDGKGTRPVVAAMTTRWHSQLKRPPWYQQKVKEYTAAKIHLHILTKMQYTYCDTKTLPWDTYCYKPCCIFIVMLVTQVSMTLYRAALEKMNTLIHRWLSWINVIIYTNYIDVFRVCSKSILYRHKCFADQIKSIQQYEKMSCSIITLYQKYFQYDNSKFGLDTSSTPILC